jgi:uncharacterized protein with FMN-binding domain
MSSMTDLPAPDPTSRQIDSNESSAGHTSDHAARLEALARRRTSTGHPTSAEGGQRVADRLAALQSRRASPAATTPAAPTSTRRRHPARGARRAALGLSLVSTGGLATWFGLSAAGAANEVSTAAIVQMPATATAPAPATASHASSSTPTPTDVPARSFVDSGAGAAAAAPAADTVVDGGVFQNKWGNVQVRATFDASGSLVDVTTLQTPGGRGRSIQINDYAVPRLNGEALTVQSANVDTVSGATYTSVDYRRSLQSAIDAARAAGATQLA